MTGQLLGLDGISSELHTCNAIALEGSEVCAITFLHLEGLSRQIDTLQHHFHKEDGLLAVHQRKIRTLKTDGLRKLMAHQRS